MISIARQHYKDDDREVIDIRNLLNVVWRGRWLIGAASLAFAALAVFLVSRIEPSYRASATVMFGEQRANVTNIDALFLERPVQSGELANEIQILTSTSLLTHVVKGLQLQDDPFFNPDLAGADAGPGSLGRLIALIRGAFDRAGVMSEPAEAPTVVGDHAVRNAVGQIRDNLRLSPVASSTVIEISLEAPFPETAARVVNAIVNQYVVDQLQVRLDMAQAATGWLTNRVEELRQQVQVSEEAVESLRTQLSVTAGQGLEITQQQLAALNAELSSAQGAAATAEARYVRLAQAMGEGRDLLGSESPLIRSYRDEEAALLARRNSLSANHPALPQIDVQLRAVHDRIADEVRRVVAAAEVESETAATRVAELEQTVRDLESRALAQSKDEIHIRQLEREAQANRLLYESLLTRLTETSEQDGLQSTDAPRILSPAETPIEPVSNNAIVMVVFAALVGALLGIGFVIVRDNINNTFRTPHQIEEATGLAVLAALPSLRGRRNRDLVGYLLSKPGSSLAEAVRNLRTSILMPNAVNPPKVVMFTSSVPGEGKSTTSMLTGITSRQMGKSAIVVDCDLRLSSIERILAVKGDGPGMLSVLDGSASLDEAIYEDPATGLHVLMARRGERSKRNGNAADVLASQQFAELLRQLSQRYDVVLLDTPPALVVTDARIVSALADSVVYIVRWGSTPRDAVIEGLKEMRSVRAPIAGTVLSMIDERRASSSIVDGYTHHRARHRAYFES